MLCISTIWSLLKPTGCSPRCCLICVTILSIMLGLLPSTISWHLPLMARSILCDELCPALARVRLAPYAAPFLFSSYTWKSWYYLFSLTSYLRTTFYVNLLSLPIREEDLDLKTLNKRSSSNCSGDDWLFFDSYSIF